MKALIAALALSTLAPACAAQPGWWMREPIRWVQTNLRETDAALDPQRFIAQVADFDAYVLLMNMGGVAGFYPSKVQKVQAGSPATFVPPSMFGPPELVQ